MVNRYAMMIVTCASLMLAAGPGQAATETVTLKLGGQFCDVYLGEVEEALKKVPGVTAVDFKARRGHAVVTGQAGTMKTGKIVDAVNALKGDNWQCKAEVVK